MALSTPAITGGDAARATVQARLQGRRIDLTGILFKAGQRIRLYVSSSDFPNVDRNHNTGRDYWSDPELRVAHQRVFHAGDLRSCLILPVIPR